jgi:tRNA-specific 2-thiouridylase
VLYEEDDVLGGGWIHEVGSAEAEEEKRTAEAAA